jgi:integrase
MNRQESSRKGSLPRAIPIPEKALAHLQAVRDGEYLLPAATPSGRQELIDWTNAWMRKQGWSFAEYSKGIHELRKLRGCEWFTLINPAYASKMLGHKSLLVTQ